MKTENEIKMALKKLAICEDKVYKEYSEAFDVADVLTMDRKLARLIPIRMKIQALNWVLNNIGYLEDEVGI